MRQRGTERHKSRMREGVMQRGAVRKGECKKNLGRDKGKEADQVKGVTKMQQKEG